MRIESESSAVVLGWQITLFLLPMPLIIHAFTAFGVTLIILGVCLTGMYFLWYKHLSSAEGNVARWGS